MLCCVGGMHSLSVLSCDVGDAAHECSWSDATGCDDARFRTLVSTTERAPERRGGVGGRKRSAWGSGIPQRVVSCQSAAAVHALSVSPGRPRAVAVAWADDGLSSARPAPATPHAHRDGCRRATRPGCAALVRVSPGSPASLVLRCRVGADSGADSGAAQCTADSGVRRPRDTPTTRHIRSTAVYRTVARLLMCGRVPCASNDSTFNETRATRRCAVPVASVFRRVFGFSYFFVRLAPEFFASRRVPVSCRVARVGFYAG